MAEKKIPTIEDVDKFIKNMDNFVDINWSIYDDQDLYDSIIYFIKLDRNHLIKNSTNSSGKHKCCLCQRYQNPDSEIYILPHYVYKGGLYEGGQIGVFFSFDSKCALNLEKYCSQFK